MILYIIRHGQTDHNKDKIIQGWSNIELNEVGIRQAVKTANVLSPVVFDYIFSSDLKRASKTAEIIAEYNKNATKGFLLDWRLRERFLGKLEGRSSENIDTSIYFQNDEKLGLEDMTDFEARVKSFVESLKKFDAKNVLIVTHSGTIGKLNDILKTNMDRCVFDNTEVMKVEI